MIHPRTIWITASLATVLIPIILTSRPAHSQTGEDPGITVQDAVIARAVKDLIPVSPAETFDADVGKLSCFTRIETRDYPTLIKHLWFYGDRLVMEITLPVNSPNWRTYSTKTILPSAKGDWRVDVTSDDGTIIKSLTFSIR